jgi:hypothetical protein
MISTDARRNGNLRQSTSGESRVLEQAHQDRSRTHCHGKAALRAHADCPDGITISVLQDGDSWEFRAKADEATAAKPGYPECVGIVSRTRCKSCSSAHGSRLGFPFEWLNMGGSLTIG